MKHLLAASMIASKAQLVRMSRHNLTEIKSQFHEYLSINESNFTYGKLMCASCDVRAF